MDKEFGAGWEVIVDDIVQEGNIDTTGSDICHNENADLACPKLAAVDATSSLQEDSGSNTS